MTLRIVIATLRLPSNSTAGSARPQQGRRQQSHLRIVLHPGLSVFEAVVVLPPRPELRARQRRGQRRIATALPQLARSACVRNDSSHLSLSLQSRSSRSSTAEALRLWRGGRVWRGELAAEPGTGNKREAAT